MDRVSCAKCGEAFKEPNSLEKFNAHLCKKAFTVQKQTNDEWYTKGKIEPNDYIFAWAPHWGEYSYFIGVIIKYLTRFLFKNGLEDLKKAKFYIDLLIEYYEGRLDESGVSASDDQGGGPIYFKGMDGSSTSPTPD